MKITSFCFVKLGLCLALIVGTSAASFGEEFYKGKVIRFVVGFSPGGGYDTYVRAIARHMHKHIPGDPTVVVQNMPGAGGLVAANYMYRKARPNGLSVWIWNSVIVLRQALGDQRVKIDAKKVEWIGSPSKDTPTCAVMGFTGLKTLSDVMSTKQRIKIGGVRQGTAPDDMPKILNKILGTKFDVITGYRGTAGIRLAMRRKEVDGACWGWESMRVTARSMLDAKGDDKLIPFILSRRLSDPEVRDLPVIPEVIKSKEHLAMFKAWAAPFQFHRPFAVPFGTSKELLTVLRKAFKATLQDPEFLSEAKKSRLVTTYVSPEEVEQRVDRILSMPAKARESLQFLVRTGEKRP